MSAIPTALPAETLDRILAALAEQRVTGMIHLFLGWPLDAPPADGDRLARAARLLVDAEPILGCRLETGGPRGVQWRRHPDPDAIPWFEALAAPSRGAAIRAVINAEEPPEGRNLILRLIRCEAEARHLLTVSVSHMVADGSAAYDCAYQLAALYNALAGDPAHRLAPNTASRDS